MHDDDPQFTNTLPSGGLVSGGRGDVAGVVAGAGQSERAADVAPTDAVDEPVDAGVLKPGDAIGRYRVRERVGEGGMGVVYAAEDPELGRVVAIKLLRAVHGREAENQQRRMLREAQALARVSHRNLVMVFDVGSLRGRVWIAMEYVAGETLETWLASDRRTWSEIVEVFAEAGRGLAAVHAAGLVHRDFKPGNVIVRNDGTVQVLDFGLATQVGEVVHEPDPSLTISGSNPASVSGSRSRAAPDLDALAANLTTTGAFMGTPAYMAPEQFMMLPTDGRADQFSLCVALYEALYGHRPFKGRDLAQLMAATLQGLPGVPSELPGVPLAVRQVIARGLSRSPDDRFPDMTALVDALVHTRTPATNKDATGWRRFGPSLLAGGGAVALATALWVSLQPDEGAPPDPPAVPTIDPPIGPSIERPGSIEPPSTPSPASIVPTPEPEPPALPGPNDVDAAAALEPHTTTPRSNDRELPQAEQPKVPTTPTGALPSLADLDERPEPTSDTKSTPPDTKPDPSSDPKAEPSKPDPEPEPKPDAKPDTRPASGDEPKAGGEAPVP